MVDGRNDPVDADDWFEVRHGTDSEYKSGVVDGIRC